MSHFASLLQNIANIIVFILLSNRLYPYFMRWSNPVRYGLIGVLFGLAGLISMQMPIDVRDGITVDLKAVLGGMSGLLGGPVSALVSFLIIGSYRVYMGGIGMPPGLICIAVSALMGSWLKHRMTGTGNFRSFRQRWWVPLLFGCFMALVQLAMTSMFPPAVRNELLGQFSLPLLLIYPVAAAAFYFFIALEWTRQNDAMFDPVTKLRRFERLQGKWVRSLKDGQPFTLVVLSVDRLESVVDLHGKPARNGLLKECGNRLLALLPAGGDAARFDGYRFIISLPYADSNRALHWLREVTTTLTEPYAWNDSPIHLTFSSGFAAGTGGTTSLETLIEQAETALRHASARGSNQTVSYDSQLNEQSRYRTSLEKDLPLALLRGQLHLHYQPQYYLSSGKLRGFEALIRWRHPEWGLVSPADFIPMAEENGLIVPIGEWVIETASDFVRQLSVNYPDLIVSVNVSAVQLSETDFPDKIAAILNNTGLEPAKLELELTESTLVGSIDNAVYQLQLLKHIGVRLALDDFGVGYSSLSYLRRLPFDLIKLDRSFIEDIGKRDNDELTKTMIDWVHQLRYDIVAEGLESYQQLHALKQWRCDIAQGFLFGRPMPVEELLPYLRIRRQMSSPLPGGLFQVNGIPS